LVWLKGPWLRIPAAAMFGRSLSRLVQGWPRCSLASVRQYKKMPSRVRPLPSTQQDWRRERKQPVNPTERGVLTDGADFSYADGRPAPPGVGQARRAAEQRQMMERIVQLTDEIDLAERLHAERTRQAEQQQELVHSRRLREKATESLDCEPR